MKTNSKGFTLIELLVVIAIIGILSTIAMTSLNGARKKAADASFKSSVASLQAIGVLCCDSSTLNTASPVNAPALNAAGANICTNATSVPGTYPTGIGPVAITQCSGGDFTIVAKVPLTGFSGTLTQGTCNATTCTFP